MIKRISIDQLRIGMYVQKLGASWLDNPFWRSAFLLDDRARLATIRESAVREIWIDTSRGVDVANAEVAPAEDLLATMVAPDDAGDAPPASSTFAEELERARRIVRGAQGAVSALYADVRLGRAIDADACLPLVEEIAASVERNRGAIVSLARLKTSDDYTYLHSVAVCALMVALSRQLGLDEQTTREAGLAGLVHDLGKALMPQHVLKKPGKLTDAEFAIIRGHPEAGYRMLEESRGVPVACMDVCLHHHERIDGGGYPHGLAGDAIALLARMGAVCDVYDAITSNRPYKSGWDPADSLHRMAQWSRDGHFDEAVFQSFVRSLGIYPTGSLVRLASGRLAVIVEQSAGSLLAPVVTAFYDAETRRVVAPERVDLSAGTDRIVSRELPERWGLADLDRYWMAAPP